MSKTQVIVGLGSCGIAAGAGKVYQKLEKIKEVDNLDFELKKTSCVGMCYKEPLVEIISDTGTFMYGEITEDNITDLVQEHIIGNNPIKELVVKCDLFETGQESYFESQVKIALRNCGHIEPESIEDYIANNGYKALQKIAGEKLSQEQVIQKMIDSGLRGRGGGGFSTGTKWKFAYNYKSDEKYIICNADEGDPGAFMDRSLLEGDPHSVIEGMIIGAYAIGANHGVIYCRAEYPLAVKRLNIALKQARDKGFLGENVCGINGFNIDIFVKEGAGAFVCGEETALIASIEGERGMPRKRPPFPAESGLWRKPSNVNNVETFANVPWIIFNGPEEYAKYGTENSSGTKVFALAGRISRGGLIEVPLGITINEIIFNIAGGIPGGKQFKAVQLGGPSGGCVPAYLGNTEIDYDSLQKTGAIMGSGGMIVMDETTCMVDMAKFFLDFTKKESCGKCTFCRIGTQRMLEILTRITEGNGQEGDIEKLEELSHSIIDNSLCGLGQTAPNPVLTTIRYFRDEYEAHIKDKRCPAKKCRELLTYEVIAENCTGCTVCAKKCPTDAIRGERKGVHFIEQDKCIKCGVCYSRCKFEAISLT
jgi:NADH-quinone oxidoreductase subunit F